MKFVEIKKFSVLGLLLIGAAAVAAAFTPAKAATTDVDPCNGHVVDSTNQDDNGQDIDRTCTRAQDSANCWTTTDTGNDTSSDTEGGVTTTNDTRLTDDVADCITIVA